MTAKRHGDLGDDAPATGPVMGSGDFLADQGYEAPDEARVKFGLANRIALLIEDHDLLQAEVVSRTGLKQADVSRIVNGNVKGYSVYRLMRALKGLGQRVTISVEAMEEETSEVETSAPLSLAL